MLNANHLPLRMLLPGVINQADIIFQTSIHILLPEFLRSQDAVTMEITILVGPFPVKLGRGSSQMNSQNSVSSCQSISDNIVTAIRLLIHVSYSLAKNRTQLRIHLPRVLRRFRFWEKILRDGSILSINIHGHGPLTAVAHHISKQKLNQPGIIFLSLSDQRLNILQEVIDPLQLVKIHGVVLRELKLFQPQIFLGYKACNIQ